MKMDLGTNCDAVAVNIMFTTISLHVLQQGPSSHPDSCCEDYDYLLRIAYKLTPGPQDFKSFLCPHYMLILSV